jgi:formylmethanofuran dehydrogenase subunit B
MTAPSILDNVTCLGCGCTCDDIAVVVQDDRIVEARNACTLGARWFGDGRVPSRCQVEGDDAPIAIATTHAAHVLGDAANPLVYLAPALSCESQRGAAAIADLLRARLDTVTSTTASRVVLAGQERGYASATFGEIRNRADLVVFWAVDVERRYPRFTSRYAPDPVGLYVGGRSSRTVIVVDVEGATSTANADRRMSIAAADEVATLTAVEALARASANELAAFAQLTGAAWAAARELAPLLLSARYIALVYDAEPDGRAERSPQRFDRLAALSHALNERTRCAAMALRAGGNRSGADSVLVAQTGYPFAVDFARGYPRYDPYDGAALARLHEGAVDVALVLGDAGSLPDDVVRALGSVPCIVIGPRASESLLAAGAVVIDTGVDGIHARGTCIRADDVPLPLRAPLAGPPDAPSVISDVGAAIRRLPSPRGGSVAAAAPSA